ncbi:MAG: DUF2220 family protein [Sporichthyaceae bacterium]|nr:DUF2220 family protein [Sporichthyaceae bacterium]
MRTKLRRRWDRGEFLAMVATGALWEPIVMNLRTPTARELANDLPAVQEWTSAWRAVDAELLQVDYRPVGGRLIGTNKLPWRVRIEDRQALLTFLGASAQEKRFGQLLEITQEHAPGLIGWVAAHPTRALEHERVWVELLATVRWIERYAGRHTYIRQIDVPGVDTKFVEQHRGVLADLLDCCLPADRVDLAYPPSEFVGRYRLRSKPGYVRIRALGAPPPELAGYAEMTIRMDECALRPIAASTVFIVENEITYLAFPAQEDAVALLGGGYGLSALGQIGWLCERNLRYWGDIDTHGFAILDRLRQAFPNTRSLLMDRETLLDHRASWVREPVPARPELRHLTAAEAALYRDLVIDVYGPAVRLEQERIRLSSLHEALAR